MEINAISGSWHSYRPAAVLKIAGEDSFLFLQGQFTQDLRPSMERHRVAYGLWLNQKGKVLADSFVLLVGMDWLVVSMFSAATALRKRLETYIIADDVTIEDVTTQWAGISVLGLGAAEFHVEHAGHEVLGDGSFAEKNGGFIFQGRRSKEPNWEWLYPVGTDDLAAVLRGHGFTELSAADMERLRIQAEIPSVPRDIGPEDLPNEGGLEREAISYSKGCYLGQEVMARLKTMGQVRRRLLRVTGPVAPPVVLPASLFVDGKKIGDLRSAVRTESGFVGLAMISLLGVTGRRLSSFSPNSLADIIITDAPA
jgi:folate-binding protein YgfZ